MRTRDRFHKSHRPGIVLHELPRATPRNHFVALGMNDESTNRNRTGTGPIQLTHVQNRRHTQQPRPQTTAQDQTPP